MKFVSLVTRIGLLALAMILISVLSADEVWADSSDEHPTTNGLADSLMGHRLVTTSFIFSAEYLPPLIPFVPTKSVSHQ